MGLMIDEWWPVLKISVSVAMLATIFVMLFSTLMALALAKYKAPWLRFIELLLYVPMAMPPVALGYALLLCLGPHSRIGTFFRKFNIDIAFTTLGAVVAAFMVSFGIGLRAMRIALEEIDPVHGQRALLMGASKFQVFYHITFPLCLRTLVGSAILVFIRSLGEFGATIVLAGNNLGTTRTLALAIWTSMQSPDHQAQCLALVAFCGVISLVALLGSELILRKRR